MWLTRLIQGIFYSGYDRRGNAKYLLGRVSDSRLCEDEGVAAEVRDEALSMLCDAFSLRPDD